MNIKEWFFVRVSMFSSYQMSLRIEDIVRLWKNKEDRENLINAMIIAKIQKICDNNSLPKETNNEVAKRKKTQK